MVVNIISISDLLTNFKKWNPLLCK